TPEWLSMILESLVLDQRSRRTGWAPADLARFPARQPRGAQVLLRETIQPTIFAQMDAPVKTRRILVLTEGRSIAVQEGERIVTDARAEAGLIIARAQHQARATLEEAERLAREVRSTATAVRQQTAVEATTALAEAQETLTEAQRLHQDHLRRAGSLEQQESALRDILERLVSAKAATEGTRPVAPSPGPCTLEGRPRRVPSPDATGPDRPSFARPVNHPSRRGELSVTERITTVRPRARRAIQRLRRAVSVEVGFSAGTARRP
ncbi:MAG: hypothetical protein M3Y91_17650, partial [Actinomycetota bacterium]|nr:hypothetical protein [Actinomycetota bacterium]